jgi:hypothetical protein
MILSILRWRNCILFNRNCMYLVTVMYSKFDIYLNLTMPKLHVFWQGCWGEHTVILYKGFLHKTYGLRLAQYTALVLTSNCQQLLKEVMYLDL